MFKIAICDDDIHFLKGERVMICKLMDQEYSNIEYKILEYTSGINLVKEYSKNDIDIIFLDIELDQEDGFDIAKKITLLHKGAKIIFVTSHENLVFESFVCRPVGFIRKRIFEQELESVMNRVVSEMIDNNMIIQVGESRNTYMLLLSSIRTIDTYQHNIILKLEKGELIVRDKLSRIEPILADKGFVTVNRGCAINMKYILKVEGGLVTLLDGSQISISRSKCKGVNKKYKEYMGIQQL